MTQADSIYAVQRYHAIGVQAFAIKDYRLAAKMFSEAIALAPTAEHCIGLGESLGQMGKLAEARAAFEKAIIIDPRCARAWYNMGVMYEKSGLNVEAESAYEKGIAIEPMAEAVNNLANCKRALLKLDEAETNYRRAMELGYAVAQLNLSLLLMLKGDYVNGLQLFETRDKHAGNDAYGPAREILRILDEVGKIT